MKLIVRADDVGYSAVSNIGAFETIEKGITTSADVMLESPGTVDALERLKEFPWISVGWHTHFWCSPVLPVSEVSSLLIPGTDRFRHDLHSAEDFSRDELEAEARAQLERCIDILGRVPDTCEARGNAPFAQVLRRLCAEYGIAVDFANRIEDPQKQVTASAQWADRKIYIMSPAPAYAKVRTESVTGLLDYNPVEYYTQNLFHKEIFPEDAVLEQSWHPGYLDYFVYREGDYGPNAKYFTTIRVVDVHALCSQELHDWVRENGVELMNFRDALYGTREYQNHLRHVGSDLFAG